MSIGIEMTWSIGDIIVHKASDGQIYKYLEESEKMFPNDPDALFKYFAKRCLENGSINSLQYLEQMYLLKENKNG